MNKQALRLRLVTVAVLASLGGTAFAATRSLPAGTPTQTIFNPFTLATTVVPAAVLPAIAPAKPPTAVSGVLSAFAPTVKSVLTQVQTTATRVIAAPAVSAPSPVVAAPVRTLTVVSPTSVTSAVRTLPPPSTQFLPSPSGPLQ